MGALKIKVLWPDGPRFVEPSYVLAAATDALVDYEGSSPEHTCVTDLGEAIDVVNKHGLLTTESYSDAAVRELEAAQKDVADTVNEVLDVDCLVALRKVDAEAAREIELSLIRWKNASNTIRVAQCHDAATGRTS